MKTKNIVISKKNWSRIYVEESYKDLIEKEINDGRDKQTKTISK